MPLQHPFGIRLQSFDFGVYILADNKVWYSKM